MRTTHWKWTLPLGVALAVGIGGAALALQPPAGQPPADRPAPKESRAAEKPGYLVYPVSTELQKELIRHQVDVYTFVDATRALRDDTFYLDELDLSGLRRALSEHAKADATIWLNLYFGWGSRSDSEAQAALRHTLTGFAYGTGFGRVRTPGTFTARDQSWEDYYAFLTEPPRRPSGPEQAIVNDSVKAYPVRSELSRCLTQDADCAVIVLPSLKESQGEIPEKVRAGVQDGIEKLKLPHKKRVVFYTEHISEETPPDPLLKSFSKLAEELGFETSSVWFR